MSYNLNKKNNKGFTLIETLVAISILLIAMVGPLDLSRQGIRSARLVKNQITSFYLAQDAVEYIRSKRDSNTISDSNWLNGLANCLGTNACSVDTTSDTIESCGASCPVMRMSSDGLYGYNEEWSETVYRRNISMLTNVSPSSDEVLLEVTILWAGDSKSFTVRENLFNLR